MEPRFCLVLTSTILVKHPEFLRPHGRITVEKRLQDYEAALHDWMTRQASVESIVFIDNSGYRLDSLKEIAKRRVTAKRVEFISFETQGYSTARGRSFGELDCLQKAMERSELVEAATHVVKATGRVFVPNFDQIIGAMAADADIVGTLSKNLTWLDTTFVLFRKELFADHLLPYALEHVDDTKYRYIERVLAQGVLRALADGWRWYPFAREPRIRGFRGLDSHPYSDGWIRTRLIDYFAWGYNRAREIASGKHQSHAQPATTPSGPNRPLGGQ